MKINLSNLGKRYNYEWIFRHLNFEFRSGNAYAILGPNGSGKSTLLQIIAGCLTLSEGSVAFYQQEILVREEKVYQCTAMAAPYLELVEELTLLEFLTFHHQFKPFLPEWTPVKIMDRLDLAKSAQKQIQHFSSGMKQRIKLGQAIFSHSPVILLDEPCSNLDAAGITLYHQLIHHYCSDRLLIISSNDPEEYQMCTHQLEMINFK
ncbi:MAG: ABC transporter ATP-binding protein [Chitinophagaceae bacterium]